MTESHDEIDEPSRQLHRKYIAGWKINGFQFENARPLNVAARYGIFLQLLRLANQMNWRTSTPEEDEQARCRWQKLRQAYQRKIEDDSAR